MPYIEVYNVRQQLPFDPWLLLTPLVGAIAVLLPVYLPQVRRYYGGTGRRRLDIALRSKGIRLVFQFCGALLLTMWLFANTAMYVEHQRFSEALWAKHCQILEGQVDNFIAGSDALHRAERFSVNGQTFQYSSNQYTGAFNRTRENGGPITSGTVVRLWHLNGKILKIEVAAKELEQK